MFANLIQKIKYYIINIDRILSEHIVFRCKGIVISCIFAAIFISLLCFWNIKDILFSIENRYIMENIIIYMTIIVYFLLLAVLIFIYDTSMTYINLLYGELIIMVSTCSILDLYNNGIFYIGHVGFGERLLKSKILCDIVMMITK